MIRSRFFALILAVAMFPGTAALRAADDVPALLNFKLKDIDGAQVNMADYLGKVILVVNVASRCGQTPQYEGLQALHRYFDDRGLRVIGVPANNFGQQEPGTNLEIKKFCESQYKITFKMMSKIDVIGPNQNPFFKALTTQATDTKLNRPIGWNFEKFLIGRDGKLVARFDSNAEPTDRAMVNAINNELRKGVSADIIPDDHQLPPSLTKYMGRTIAQTMHWQGGTWLLRNVREREEATSKFIKQLNLQPGMKVGDVGCGNGYHALMMSELVGATGKVYCVDIQHEMLQMLVTRCQDQNVTNVVPIHGTLADTRLPENELDVVILVDAYHEFSHPEHMLQSIRKSLKPNGRVVLLEFRAEDNDVPIKPLHKMSKAQVRKELVANGFKLVDDFDGLPWQHMMSFGKAGK